MSVAPQFAVYQSPSKRVAKTFVIVVQSSDPHRRLNAASKMPSMSLSSLTDNYAARSRMAMRANSDRYQMCVAAAPRGMIEASIIHKNIRVYMRLRHPPFQAATSKMADGASAYPPYDLLPEHLDIGACPKLIRM